MTRSKIRATVGIALAVVVGTGALQASELFALSPVDPAAPAAALVAAPAQLIENFNPNRRLAGQ